MEAAEYKRRVKEQRAVQDESLAFTEKCIRCLERCADAGSREDVRGQWNWFKLYRYYSDRADETWKRSSKMWKKICEDAGF